METIYVVIYRYSPTDKWQPKNDGAFTEKHLAQKYVEVLSAQAPKGWEYVYMTGTRTPTATEQLAAEEALGAF